MHQLNLKNLKYEHGKNKQISILKNWKIDQK